MARNRYDGPRNPHDHRRHSPGDPRFPNDRKRTPPRTSPLPQRIALLRTLPTRGHQAADDHPADHKLERRRIHVLLLPRPTEGGVPGAVRQRRAHRGRRRAPLRGDSLQPELHQRNARPNRHRDRRAGKSKTGIDELGAVGEVGCSNNPTSCTDAATTSSGVSSTRRSSKPSTSRTRRSQTLNSRNPSGCSTPSSATGPQQPARSPQTKRPPALRVAFARRQALGSYFVAFIQALVLVRPLGWSCGESNPGPSRCERDALPTALQPRTWCAESVSGGAHQVGWGVLLSDGSSVGQVRGVA